MELNERQCQCTSTRQQCKNAFQHGSHSFLGDNSGSSRVRACNHSGTDGIFSWDSDKLSHPYEFHLARPSRFDGLSFGSKSVAGR